MATTGGRPRHVRAEDYERLVRDQRLRRFGVVAAAVVAGGVGIMATTAMAADTTRIGGALVRIQSAGCGFVGNGKGLAIDERHVVTNWGSVRVDATPSLVTPDGTTVEARVIGGDESADVAVLQVDAPLPAVLPVDMTELSAAGTIQAVVDAATVPAVDCGDPAPAPAPVGTPAVDHSVVPTIVALPTDR